MPQAALPDINTSFIKWRNKITYELGNQNYTGVLGSLNNFNACLDDKFTVNISTEEYEQKLADEKLQCVCGKCKKEQNFKEVKKVTQRNSPVLELITRKKYERVWLCPDCKNENLIQGTEFIQKKLPNPYYFGVVPDPPRRRSTLDKKEFHKKFEAWVWTFFGELEHAATQYRIEHWEKNKNSGDAMIISDEDDKAD